MAVITKRIIENGVVFAEKYGYFRYPDFSLVSFYPNKNKKQEIKTIKRIRPFFGQSYNSCILRTFTEDGNLDILAEALLYCNSSSFKLILSGTAKRFYPNGHLRFTVDYINNIRQGKMEFFYNNGDTEMILNYDDGEPIEGIAYSPQGDTKALTLAHINNLLLDYDIKLNINISWINKLHTRDDLYVI